MFISILFSPFFQLFTSPQNLQRSFIQSGNPLAKIFIPPPGRERMRVSLLLVTLLIFPCAFAAVIEGTVYDLSLEPTESVVQIDSTPQQRVVAKGGVYRLSIPVGEYHITAEGVEGNTTENVTIIADGTYTIDLFLRSEEHT